MKKYNILIYPQKSADGVCRLRLKIRYGGRHTFISNALMLGIPVQVVMQWSVHSDYHSMRPYIAIADEAKKKAMSLFDR